MGSHAAGDALAQSRGPLSAFVAILLSLKAATVGRGSPKKYASTLRWASVRASVSILLSRGKSSIWKTFIRPLIRSPPNTRNKLHSTEVTFQTKLSGALAQTQIRHWTMLMPVVGACNYTYQRISGLQTYYCFPPMDRIGCLDHSCCLNNSRELQLHLNAAPICMQQEE